MHTPLYAVSDDPSSPTPVTLDRIRGVIEHLGASMETAENGKAGLAVFDGVRFLFSFASNHKFLSVRAIWATDLEASAERLMSFFTAADSWNREKYFPTVYNLLVDDMIQVVADYICDIDCGQTDAQLLDNVAAGVATGVDAIQYMHQAAQSIIR
ncbi:MAG: YbjN domain-containing protein [Actinomycetaceae bacterium]|nr:YbjN domain-containing protein [Actinomycetaceae bacterium]